MVQNSSDSTALPSVRIVLVAPAGPLNVGSVARVMKNFGLSQLVLVAPQCDPLDAEALQMAVHAKDLLQNARQVETIPEALEGCARAIATTARTRGFNAPLELPEVALSQLVNATLASSTDSALIFGPEDRGLSNEELIYAQQYVKVPTHPGYSALNLAQAVAICCYELYRATDSVKKDTPDPLLNPPLSAKQTESVSQTIQPGAELNELEGYYQHLESVLLKVEYLLPHTAPSRMRKLRQLLHRANPSSNDIALLRGMLRQVEWALSESSYQIQTKDEG